MALDISAIIRVTILSCSVPSHPWPGMTKYTYTFLMLGVPRWYWCDFSSLRRKQESLIPLPLWLGWILGVGEEIKVELTFETKGHCCPWSEISCTIEARGYSPPTAKQWEDGEISEGKELEWLLLLERKVGKGRLKCLIPQPWNFFIVWRQKDASCYQWQ